MSDQSEPVNDTPPPAEIASMDVLEAEAGAPTEDNESAAPPTVSVRGTEFRLRSAVPSTLLGRFASIAREAAKWQAKLPKPADGEVLTVTNPTPQQAKAAEKMGDLMAQSYDALAALIDAEDREDFKDTCDLVDPPLTESEQSTIIKDAIEKITGRPTVPS